MDAASTALPPAPEAEPPDSRPAAAGQPAIEVRDLTKRYRGTIAVDRLSFVVRRGIVTGFLGPNGAGKTTTMRILLGLARPDGGSATILGRPYRLLAHPARRVGALIEPMGVHPGRIARQHLRILAMQSGGSARRADDLLEWAGLGPAADRRAGALSSGMRQRLVLIGALLAKADVLILDEPGNGLDPEGTRWLRGFLRSLAAEGTTVFVSSHVLSEIAQTADEVVIIDRGRCLAHDRIEALTAAAEGRVIVRSPEADRLAECLRRQPGRVAAAGDGRLVVQGLAAEDVGRIAAASGVVLSELRLEEPTLEDVFLSLTRTIEDRDDRSGAPSLPPPPVDGAA
jgi:ABC-2 type transport system ATP-binding protein